MQITGGILNWLNFIQWYSSQKVWEPLV